MPRAPASKAPVVKYSIDVSKPAKDRILDSATLEKFLRENIKVEGKTGQLGDNIKVVRDGNTTITVQSQIPLSKRYIKYLIKRCLSKNGLRDWIRVVASSKGGYELRFYNIAAGDEEEED
ncbi:60S ribosomal protein L22 [Leucoagaricus gongylophorus]